MQDADVIESVFFDIDGTLVDSNDQHARAWADTFAEFDQPYAFGDIRPLIGMGTDKLLAQLGTDIDINSERGQALTARRKEIFLKHYLHDVVGFRGARELVQWFKARSLRCIVTSSAGPEELEPLLAAAGAGDVFDHRVSPDEIESTKPDPDVILAALAWSKTRPQQALMIGDTSYDIESAHRAGVRCIGLRSGGASDEALSGADAVFDSPFALLRALEDSTLEAVIHAGHRTSAI